MKSKLKELLASLLESAVNVTKYDVLYQTTSGTPATITPTLGDISKYRFLDIECVNMLNGSSFGCTCLISTNAILSRSWNRAKMCLADGPQGYVEIMVQDYSTGRILFSLYNNGGWTFWIDKIVGIR